MSVNPSDRRNSPSLAGKINDHETRITSVESRATSLESRATALEGTYNPGWFAIPSTLTYASADAPTFVITAPSDATTIYTPGMRMRLVQTQALTSLWRMENNSVDTIAAHNGADTNITYSAGNAKFGSYGAGFNGASSKIVLTDHADFKPTGPFTIGAWIKTNSGSQNPVFQSYSANTNAAGFRLVHEAAGVMSLYSLKNTGTTATVDYDVATGTTNINDNAWHFVVGTWDGSWLRIYIDGVLDGQKYWANAPAYAATNYVRIGCQNLSGADGNFFSGAIDDVFLINGYALGETNIKDIYDTNATIATSYALTKYFLVSKVAATAVTVYGGTDYVLTNAAITSPYVAGIKAPNKFPMDQSKWSVEFNSDALQTKNTPTGGTWYQVGTHQISVPIGAWKLSFFATLEAFWGSATDLALNYICLSTSNSSSSNSDLVASMILTGASATNLILAETLFREKYINISSKTTYYMLHQAANSISALYVRGDASRTVIRAVSTLL